MLDPKLLAQLRAIGFEVSQHDTRPDEWYAGTILPDGSGGSLGGGDTGPYPTAEAALVGGVKWLIGILRDSQQEADEAYTALRALQAEVRAE